MARSMRLAAALAVVACGIVIVWASAGATRGAHVHECTGAKRIDQPATDRDGGAHASRIDAEFSVSVQRGGQSYLLGFEYQTYGGREYFQFASAVAPESGTLRRTGGPGAVVPFHGDVRQAVAALARAYGVEPRQLPFPYGTVDARTTIARARC